MIVFDEKQIQELSVKLKWQPGLGSGNADRSTEASVATNILNQSTCSVTISDPYLSGLAWPVLYDAASIYSQSSVSEANNIVLPPCKENQDPYRDKCAKYVDVEGDKASGLSSSDFAFLYIGLWYDVKGTSFGTDFYFRVSGFSVSHGTRYPSVTIRGIEARSVLFNQSLINLTLTKGKDVDETLKELIESFGYVPMFCANPNEDLSRKRIIPTTARYKGITPDEAIKKILNSVGGNMLSLPTMDYANKISICSRAEIEQGCSIFYLGKGLYEGYEVSGQPELTLLSKNLEQGSNVNDGDPYASASFGSASYFIGDIVPQTRKKAMEKVKKIAFPGLFAKGGPQTKNAAINSGYVWRDQKPASPNAKGIVVLNEEATQIEKKLGLNLFGIAPNGTKAISFLSGEVVEASKEGGRVLIKTDFSLQICEKEGSKKCFFRQIFQESTNLSDVKVKELQKVWISDEIGTSTTEKKEFIRLYILGHTGKQTTLNPQIVWDWAFPKTSIPKTQDPVVSTQKPGEQSTQSAPASTRDKVLVGRIGSTGRSTGPHLHVEISSSPENAGYGSGIRIDTKDVDPYLLIGDKPPSGWIKTSGYGPRDGKLHAGIDFAGGNILGQPLYLRGGASIITSGTQPGGYGNYVVGKLPDGRGIFLAHLLDKSIPSNIAGLSTNSSGGKAKPTIQSSPSIQGLTVETSFKGVPRALRIIPGRTILSFISDYDAWLDNNRDPSIDPGVWIPKRFKNWFVSECQYRWREGDLRVEIEGINAWGTSAISAPNFNQYLEGMKKAGELKLTKNYYDYIRSIGDLNWKMDDGQDSTAVRCKDAQYLTEFLTQGDNTNANGSQNPSSVSSVFPASKCRYTGNKYPRDRVQGIIDASFVGGMKTKEAVAGAVGNAIVESTQNGYLNPAAVGDSGNALGIFQWNSRRPELIAFARRLGRSATDFWVQMQFYVYELKNTERATIPAVNAARSVAQAAVQFEDKYERAGVKAHAERIAAAQEIFNNLSCS